LSCEHEKYIPAGNDNTWDLMTWTEEPDLTVNICKKCGTLYGEGMKT